MNSSSEQVAHDRAVRLAQSLRMGRTMVAIQDGCSVEKVRSIAFEEHMALHKHCPCCRGSEDKALEISNLIVSILCSLEK